MNYVRSTATITKRTPKDRKFTPEMVTAVKALIRDGEVQKGSKTYQAPKDADNNALINARVIWRAIQCTMKTARKIMAKLIEEGYIQTEAARYSELHGEEA